MYITIQNITGHSHTFMKGHLVGVSAVDPCLNSCLQPKGVQSKSTQSEREDKQASHQKVEVDVRARLVVRLACVWLNAHTHRMK